MVNVTNLVQDLKCKLGFHDYNEQRHRIASSNVTEITKTCQRCGYVDEDYQPS